MNRNRWVGVVGLIAALGVCAIAIAAGRGPQMDAVAADITYTHVTLDFRICEAPGGTFEEDRVRVLGTSEGDPSLTGDVEVTLKALFELETGEATQQGRLVIRDADTGRKKASATFTDAGVEEILQGMVVGSVRPRGTSLIANWRTTFHDNGAITAQIGGEAADGRLPAVVTSGRCKGPFTHAEFDVPPPESAVARTRASGQRVGWSTR
jgi:hypothetical protein